MLFVHSTNLYVLGVIQNSKIQLYSELIILRLLLLYYLYRSDGKISGHHSLHADIYRNNVSFIPLNRSAPHSMEFSDSCNWVIFLIIVGALNRRRTAILSQEPSLTCMKFCCFLSNPTLVVCSVRHLAMTMTASGFILLNLTCLFYRDYKI